MVKYHFSFYASDISYLANLASWQSGIKLVKN